LRVSPEGEDLADPAVRAEVGGDARCTGAAGRGDLALRTAGEGEADGLGEVLEAGQEAIVR
jgi:hypothetical protein